MTKPTKIPAITARPLTLTLREREALASKQYRHEERAILADLIDPFIEVYERYVSRDCSIRMPHKRFGEDFHFCARIMLELNCTYWAFDWERLLAWKRALLEREPPASEAIRRVFETRWSRVMSALFFLGVLPYSEDIHKIYHSKLAIKWLGRERVNEIAKRFINTAKMIGYKHTPTLRKNGVGVLLSVLVFCGKTDIAELTKADLERWQSVTKRSKRVACASITCIQKVLAAMGNLGGEPPRVYGGTDRGHFGWGRTAPAIIEAFERFLADLLTISRPSTVTTYRVNRVVSGVRCEKK